MMAAQKTSLFGYFGLMRTFILPTERFYCLFDQLYIISNGLRIIV